MPRLWSYGVLAACVAAAACSAKQMGINRMAAALAATATSYSRDNDPEFVRLAAPSTLKMVEMLLDNQPRHEGLLMTACSGFTQYAYGFLHVESEMLQPTNAALASELHARAGAMYGRARGYCFKAIETRHPGFGGALSKNAHVALQGTAAADVAALFWLGASWGGALAVADDQALRIGELATVRALLERALALDETWQHGAIHEALIAVEGLPSLVGGSPTRARAHFDRAVELSNGQSAFAYVTCATSVSLPAGNRTEFDRLLEAALAIDVNRRPDLRLTNLIAQKRARFLRARASTLFRSR